MDSTEGKGKGYYVGRKRCAATNEENVGPQKSQAAGGVPSKRAATTRSSEEKKKKNPKVPAVEEKNPKVPAVAVVPDDTISRMKNCKDWELVESTDGLIGRTPWTLNEEQINDMYVRYESFNGLENYLAVDNEEIVWEYFL